MHLRVDWLAEGAVERLFEALARRGTVDGDVLVPIGNPNVGHGSAAELPAHLGADLAAADAVFDPEFADGRVGMREREPVGGLWVREISGVEIEPQAIVFG